MSENFLPEKDKIYMKSQDCGLSLRFLMKTSKLRRGTFYEYLENDCVLRENCASLQLRHHPPFCPALLSVTIPNRRKSAGSSAAAVEIKVIVVFSTAC